MGRRFAWWFNYKFPGKIPINIFNSEKRIVKLIKLIIKFISRENGNTNQLLTWRLCADRCYILRTRSHDDSLGLRCTHSAVD